MGDKNISELDSNSSMEMVFNAESPDYKRKKSSNQSLTSAIETSSCMLSLDRCELASWGLPLTILRKYESHGITSMFPWQVECLSNAKLIERNRNLVYSAPTSAGKTLVAEILVIKTILERKKKVIFILPFISVVREKMYYFQNLLTESGFRVEGFMGGCAPTGGFAATDMAIATIEKANSLLNQLMEEGNLSDLGAVVIDELHLLGDPHRGYLLELLLTKLKYMNLRDEKVHVQLIGMSATLPNLVLLAKWLDAELYRTEFRPVPLNELCKIGDIIYDREMRSIRNLQKNPSLVDDPDNVLQLCIETLSDNNSVLIFCPTKNWCETLARQIATKFCNLGHENKSIGSILREQLTRETIMETLEQLKRCPAGLDNVLKSTVSFGTAFHHAGLTMDEREVIEGAFRSGAIRVLTATSTLSCGVNLPARRVIIRSLMFHGKPLDTLSYKQMIGRAGRMGKDTAGESILICKNNEIRAATSLLSSGLPPIESCLEGSEPMIRALLEAVASEVAYTVKDIELYAKCTLVSVTSEDLMETSIMKAIKFLVDNELFLLQTNENGDQRWIATQLGKACLAASIPPTDGLFIFEELQKARKCFVLDTELHVVYLVTPINSSNQIGQIDWFAFMNIWKNLTESERRVGQLVGIEENIIISAIRGSMKNGKVLDVHKRFYTAMALHDLVREISLIDVCRKYGVCRGVIQSLQQSAATFAGMVTQFCKKLGWDCMELLIGQFQARLQFGVCRELLDLLRLPTLNGLRARSLYKEGITSVSELAVANVLDVERGLHKALPFESGKEYNGEDKFDAAKRNKIRSVFVTGRDGLTIHEAAIILVTEARTFLQNELGLDDLQWRQREHLTKVTQSSDLSTRKFSTESIDESTIGESVAVTDDRVDRDKIKELQEPQIVKNHAGIGKTDAQIQETTLESMESKSEGGTRLSGNWTETCFRTSSSIEHVQSQTNDKTLEKNVENAEELSVPEKVAVNASNCRNGISQESFETSVARKCVESKDVIMHSKVDEKIDIEGTFEFTDIISSVNSEVKSTGSKTGGDICEKNLCGLSKTLSVHNSDKVIVTSDSRKITSKRISKENVVGHKTQRTMSEDVNSSKINKETFMEDTFEFTNTPNSVDPDVIIIGTKTGEKIHNEYVSKLENNRNSINSKADIVSPMALRTLSKEISDFGDNNKEILSSNNVEKEILMEDTFEYPGTPNSVDQDVMIIGSQTRQEIYKENVPQSVKTPNIINSKVNTVPPKYKTMSEDIYDLERSTKFINLEEISTPKTGDSVFNKIFKFTGTQGKTIDPEENAMGPSVKVSITSPIVFYRESLSKDPDSRSPSLFDDSLNLDTQECNMLEQNVIDSLNISAFGETNLNIGSERNTLENQRSNSMKTNRKRSAGSQRKSSSINSNPRPLLSTSDLLDKSSKSLVWGDDSWNNTNDIVDPENIFNGTRIISRNFSTPPNSKIKEKPETSQRRDHEDRLFPRNRVTELQRTAKKRKSSDSNIEVSPIARSIKLTEVQRLSTDSYKSDSDDVVRPSQNTRSSINVTKNHTRMKLESLRRSRTRQKQNQKSEQLEDNLMVKKLHCERCSIGSTVSSFDENSPVNQQSILKKNINILPAEKKASKLRKRLLSPGKKNIDKTRFKKPASICPKELQVVNVTSDLTLFNQFQKELLSKRDIALALACDIYSNNSNSIGTKIIGITSIDGRKKTKKIDNCVYGNKKICGVAISWDGVVVQYISFDNTRESKVPVKERLDLLTRILTTSSLTVRCFSFKETYKILYNCCRITSSCKFLDPITADWLLNPDNSDRCFNSLIAEHLSEGRFLLQRTETASGLNVKSLVSSEIRATTEAALTWHLTNNLITKLEACSSKLLETFRDVEMEILPLLARMELSGLGVNLTSLQELSQVIQEEMIQLESIAYSLAGKKFNFSSSKSVAQILELNKAKKKVSTSKAVLQHCENPIARLVSSWRKLRVTQVQVVFPLLSLAECNSRIHGNCITNTATGRISMHEPNLQNVPRDFNSHDDSYIISVRMAFVPMNGNLILSADYCQLELRILAHFSEEPNLCRILRKKGDVFKNIAARWYNVAEDKIDDNMRQKTKQLCYGMIYGMGTKTLAETLAVTEREAKEFLESFMGAYPGIRQWLSQVIEQTRADGYVTTFMSRRRFLPALNSEKSSDRSQAERQAVNTKVQGSAADITKRAMVRIDERMRREFPDTTPLVLTDIPMRRKLRNTSPDKVARGGHLVLQIHDELLYEVNAMDLQQVGKIVQESMEKSCSLRVPLPVKLKVGQTWGDLAEMKFE
ncbi:DNA polymerase theta [Venturia canescens]|uniref:DNA polymerase theta n=1 Tax=Venturia canescens TaxID=32260 RepID=UPI001C9C01E9|nr:DNA polymerase theta [Venturia canescens]XP_043272295.1 DNA polymerase theta [Venturia canescens]